MKERLEYFESFAQECDYFEAYDGAWDYACGHPDCEDNGGDYKRCCTFTCPLSYMASKEDMERLDPKFAHTLGEGDWVVVHSEI